MKTKIKTRVAFVLLALSSCLGDDEQSTNTGNSLTLNASSITYVAEEVIGQGLHTISLVGKPGALIGDGEVRAQNLDQEGESLASSRGAADDFLVVIRGSHDDTIRLVFENDKNSTALNLLLVDDLSSVEIPEMPLGTPLAELESSDTEVRMRLSQVLNPLGVFVVFNRATGSVVETDQAVDVLLPGSAGDTVCLFFADESTGRNSPALCQTL